MTMPSPKGIRLDQFDHDHMDSPPLYPLVMPTTGKSTGRRQGKRKTVKSPATESPSHHDSQQVPLPTQHNDNELRRHSKHRAGAYRRLGISPEESRRAPAISHILAHAEGGIDTVLQSLRFCDDPDAVKFLDKFDSVSETDAGYLTIEDIATAAGVSTKRLLELAVSSLVEDSRNAGAIIAATYHPRVIRATAVYGINSPLAGADRRLFLSGTGFLPQPVNRNGGVLQVQVNNQIVNGDGEGDNPPLIPAEDDLKSLHESIDGHLLLESPKSVINASSVTIGHAYKEDEALSPIPVPAQVRK